MKNMKLTTFKDFLDEETVAADIATVDTKLDLVQRSKHLHKGKRCKLHKELNCEECLNETWHDWEE